MARTGRPRPTPWRWTAIASLAVLALAALAIGAGAHDAVPPHSAHGELTYHDERDGEPTRDLRCQFWVKGTNVTHASGTIEVGHRHPEPHSRFAGPVHAHTVGAWEAEPDGRGNHTFVAGPFQLHETEDHMTVRAKMNASGFHRTGGHAGFDYEPCEDPGAREPPPPPRCASNVEAQARDGAVNLTWLPAEGAETYLVQRTISAEADQALAEITTTAYVDDGIEPDTSYEYRVIARDGIRDADCPSATAEVTTPREGPPPPPECPVVTAEAQDDGDVRLDWQSVDEADAYHVYRATGDGELEHVNATNATQYLDRDTEPEQTYRYQVRPANEHGEPEGCRVVEATAIPFFGNGGLALALVGGLAIVGVGWARRS